MSFSYFDNDKQLQKIDIQVGGQWADYKTDNEKLNSIFNDVDDGDGIVQIAEKAMVDSMIKQADNLIDSSANNNILEAEELEKFDLETARLMQTFDSSYYTEEKIKGYYPDEKYTYTKNGEMTTITDKETGRKIMEYKILNESFQWAYVNEFSQNDTSYNVQINGSSSSIRHNTSKDNWDKSLTFHSGRLEKIYDDKNNIKLGWRENIEQALFSKNLQNPEWLNNNAVDALNEMPFNSVINTLQNYYNDTHEFLLTKIYTSKEVSNETKYKILDLLKKLEAQAGYKQEMTNENSQVNTSFYQSKDSYKVVFKDDIITVSKNPSEDNPDEEPKVYTINMKKLLLNVPLDLRPYTKAAIQQMPGEALMDMAIECDYFGSPLGETDLQGNTAGLFNPISDKISFGFTSIKIKPSTIIHELGHAIDHRKFDRSDDVPESWKYDYSIEKNPELKKAYFNAKYKFMGFDKYLIKDPETGKKRIDEEGLMRDGYLSDKKKWTSKYYRLENKAYMYTDVLEGPSELYLFAMYGDSENTPKDAVTPELMEEYLKSLQQARSLDDNERHLRQ